MIKSVKRLGAAVLSAVMMLTAVATPLASAAAEGTFPESVTGETETTMLSLQRQMTAVLSTVTTAL